MKTNGLGTLRNSIGLGLKLIESKGQLSEEPKKGHKYTNKNNMLNTSEKEYEHDLEAKCQHEHNQV